MHSLWSPFLKKLKGREKIFKYGALNIKKGDIFCGYCRYTFDIWYLFDISHCRLTWRSRKQPPNKTESIKWFTTEPPHYMSYHIYKLSQFTETPTKQTMIAAEEAVLTQTLALLPPLLIFGRTPKCFDTAVWFFLVLALNRRSHIHADLFNSSFLSAIWLSQDQFWVIIKRIASITQSLHFYHFLTQRSLGTS